MSWPPLAPSSLVAEPGLRYTSRLGDYECWAIFEGVAIIDRVDNAIAKDDARLLAVARAFDLTIH